MILIVDSSQSRSPLLGAKQRCCTCLTGKKARISSKITALGQWARLTRAKQCILYVYLWMFCPEKLALAYREHMGIHVAGYFPSQHWLTDIYISWRYKHCRSMLFMRSYFLTLSNVTRTNWFIIPCLYLFEHFITPAPLSKPSFWFLVFWADLKLWCRGRTSSKILNATDCSCPPPFFWTLNKFLKASMYQWTPQSKVALNARIIALLLLLNVQFLFSLNADLFLYYESARTDLLKNFSGLYRQFHSKILIFLFTVNHAKERTRIIFVQ